MDFLHRFLDIAALSDNVCKKVHSVHSGRYRKSGDSMLKLKPHQAGRHCIQIPGSGEISRCMRGIRQTTHKTAAASSLRFPTAAAA
jgi:imidazoleglycerol phosphate synthase glutamine amidotransferase subunit HisH